MNDEFEKTKPSFNSLFALSFFLFMSISLLGYMKVWIIKVKETNLLHLSFFSGFVWYASFVVCRMKDTSRKNNMFAQFRKNERDKQKLIDTVVKQLKNLIATNQAWESQRIRRRPASWWLATIRACACSPPLVGHTVLLTHRTGTHTY